MKMRYLAVVLCAAAATVCAHAQDAGILKLPQDIEFKGPLSGAPFGRGETWDESKFTAYPAGTFYSEPQKAPHFTWAKDGDVVIQITGIGPSGKTFIKPAN